MSTTNEPRSGDATDAAIAPPDVLQSEARCNIEIIRSFMEGKRTGDAHRDLAIECLDYVGQQLHNLLAATPATAHGGRVPIAWSTETSYGKSYAFADEFLETFPTFPVPPSQPAGGFVVDEAMVEHALNAAERFTDAAGGDASKLDDGQWKELMAYVLEAAIGREEV